MRVRNISNAKELLKEYAYYIENPSLSKGNWKAHFKNHNPIHIEIGMGKGQFLTTLAKTYNSINYIGIEKIEELVLKSVRNLENTEISNMALIHLNALNLQDVFLKGEVKRIYLNFSDPWPKARHEKRRLTHSNFLKMYRSILSEDGEIHLKTDSLDLFEFSLGEIDRESFYLNEIIYDLYNKQYNEIAKTEYEEKFISQGKPIYKCIASINKD
ncbi:tRNA (guanosine(46)-N7)-methyltransferase TrmB [Alkaliphilus sp. MSJ-5]|uniref:tRNA (guanine-N(7)-)-methyltransferase n=1 Tax=Alkaliphilus flagellatus TaxID=2841507 RepID=A0ABS6G702_9FIRM|nr:tRNA (guanosine(46)-N7)-methyltransferase TrmB [Alkaliphilus flagellatus]MBU5677161.1 tRNA (guanosine(46)-N7)-methyltransferase TrmB [Alkaliphilus flagellatus]